MTLKENVMTMQIGFAYKPFDPFYEILNEYILRLIENGYISRVVSAVRNPKGIIAQPEKVPPQVLTFDQLELGFMISFIPAVCGVAAFALEIGIYWLIGFLHYCIRKSFICTFVRAFLRSEVYYY